MARPHIREEPSGYYPPRARWYSRLFYLADGVRRRTAMDRLKLPKEIKVRELLAGIIVPGLAVYLRGPKLWGWCAMGICATLLFSFIVWMGFIAANIAFGLLISLHCTGFIYYCTPLISKDSFRDRLRFTILTLLGIGLFIYLPARNLVQDHWLTPLRLNGKVMVVQRIFAVKNIHRADWVAYDLRNYYQGDAHNGGAIWVRDGLGLGPVLATAGDQVMFNTNSFSVNGVSSPALPYMPTSGGLTVQEGQWFVWPTMDVSGHGNVSQANITVAMLDMSIVNQTQFFGKPFSQWFGRKQTTP